MQDELTDKQWATIQPLLSRQTGPGKPRADDRETLDAILYVMSMGCRWENLKKTRYSHDHTTAWRRLTMWEEEDGTRKRVLERLVSKGFSLRIIRMDELSIDSTTVPAKNGGSTFGYYGHKHIKDMKVHAVTTRDSLHVVVAMSSGNAHEGRKLIPVVESISIKRAKGRPRRRPRILYADTKYNMPLNKFFLDVKRMRSQMVDSPAKKRRRGRPRVFI